MQAISQGPTITPRIDKTPIEDADRAAAKFIVSWETLSRVVMTQAIVRALSAIRDAMHEAFESNLEFMTRMAEIQSISPGVSTSLDSIAEHVADLSRQFNVPIAQVAEAQYQAISNQFTTTAQQTELLTAALKLSKVAVMDAGQAVNLVAGALNAYRMGSGQAEEVAAQFFATIQVGRVRGEELASVLGRVMAVSSELGVSLEELNAMMVTLTISGVKPAEAATALRSAMMALLKPSQDLKKELHELGFESGPQMIAALGLEGALLKLRDSVDENMSAFAKLIPNVRAISGALRETDDGGKRTAEALEHLREVSVAAFNEKYKLFIESDAQKTLTRDEQAQDLLDDGPGCRRCPSGQPIHGLCRRRGRHRSGHQGVGSGLADRRSGLRQFRGGNGGGGDVGSASGLGAWPFGSGRQRFDDGTGGLRCLRFRQHPHHPEHPASRAGLSATPRTNGWR